MKMSDRQPHSQRNPVSLKALTRNTKLDLVHSEHNRSRKSGGFALIILGALLLFLAPNIYPQMPQLGTAALIGGMVVGGIGFYLKFVRGRSRNG